MFNTTTTTSVTKNEAVASTKTTKTPSLLKGPEGPACNMSDEALKALLIPDVDKLTFDQLNGLAIHKLLLWLPTAAMELLVKKYLPIEEAQRQNFKNSFDVILHLISNKTQLVGEKTQLVGEKTQLVGKETRQVKGLITTLSDMKKIPMFSDLGPPTPNNVVPVLDDLVSILNDFLKIAGLKPEHSPLAISNQEDYSLNNDDSDNVTCADKQIPDDFWKTLYTHLFQFNTRSLSGGWKHIAILLDIEYLKIKQIALSEVTEPGKLFTLYLQSGGVPFTEEITDPVKLFVEHLQSIDAPLSKLFAALYYLDRNMCAEELVEILSQKSKLEVDKIIEIAEARVKDAKSLLKGQTCPIKPLRLRPSSLALPAPSTQEPTPSLDIPPTSLSSSSSSSSSSFENSPATSKPTSSSSSSKLPEIPPKAIAQELGAGKSGVVSAGDSIFGGSNMPAGSLGWPTCSSIQPVQPSSLALSASSNQKSILTSNLNIPTLTSSFSSSSSSSSSSGTWEMVPSQNSATSNPTSSSSSYKLQEIPEADLTILEPLGVGGSGAVFKATWNSVLVAAKILQHLSSQDRENLLKEADIMARLSHPNIIQFFGICGNKIVMEFAELGSLSSVIHQKTKPNDALPIAALWTERGECKISLDILCGLLYLHSKDIIHRDLKSSNVLLFLVGKILLAKLSDFGLSKSLTTSQTTTGGGLTGTPAYLAPGIMKGQPHTKPSDVYAFGILLWEIFEKAIPFSSYSNIFSLIPAVIGGERPEFPEGTQTPKEIKRLATTCWAPKPDNRPTAKKACKEFSDFFATLPAETQQPAQSSSSSSSGVFSLDDFMLTREGVAANYK